MTRVDEASKQGYFPGPYPVHLAASDAGSIPQTFGGTMNKLISCPAEITPGCFQEQPMTVTVDRALAHQVAADGAKLVSNENHNIYQQDSGAWQMALTYFVSSSKHPKSAHWKIIVHAHPASVPAHSVPTSWVADSLLVGSLTDPTKGNYDGKYVEDGGKLYLVYSRRTPDKNVLVAQRMKSPRKPASTAPTLLLAPGDYTSEYATGQHGFRLIETGNVTRIDGKYVLVYSAGVYDLPDYKIGIAWSDTFLPAAGHQYRKVTMTDTAGVWGKPGQPEVRYLLQSQKSDWPNYSGHSVIAPGVASVVEDANHWYLYFAGYLPSDAPKQPGSDFYQGSHRRPYYASLTIDIPPGASVAKASDADLARWITIDTGR